MKKYLIHTHAVSGHHLEYLHHLYISSVSHDDSFYYFVVPKQFLSESNTFDWPKASNVAIVIMDEKEEEPAKCSLIKKSYINAKTIKKYCRKYQTTDVITLSVMSYLPLLPLYVRKIRFSSIVYRIYLYEWKEESFIKKTLDSLKYIILSRCNIFYRVFICNDSASAHYLNRLYKVNKYQYLPDPVSSIIGYNGKDLRSQFGIAKDKKIFLHPGSIDSYKNTLGILKSLLSFDKETANKIAVIFAGRVVPGIKNDFNRLFNEVKDSVELYFIEGYIPFEELADLFVTCDYVLVPYTVKCQSSGVIGHAAYYGKPVIAVQGGVIGKMVKKWKLGYLLKDASSLSIYECIKALLDKPSISTKGNKYLETHTIDAFNDTIMGDF